MVKGIRPANIKEALAFLSQEPRTIMAGGTDLMVQKARGFALPPGFDKPLLFIDHLVELKKIYKKDGQIHIGAGAILTDMLYNKNIPGIFKEIVIQMASPPTRNMASIGGNLCNASPAGDTLPYLYAVDAEVILESLNETRCIKIEEFIVAPKKTCIRPDELLTDIIIPEKEYTINSYRKLGQRKGMSLTKASFLGMADIDNNIIKDIRIALGSVAPFIVRSKKIENQMVGKEIETVKKTTENILEKYGSLIKPIDDARSTAGYRKKVSLRLINDFITNL